MPAGMPRLRIGWWAEHLCNTCHIFRRLSAPTLLLRRPLGERMTQIGAAHTSRGLRATPVVLRRWADRWANEDWVHISRTVPGILLTIAIVVAFDVLARHNMPVVQPFPILLLSVAIAGYLGGHQHGADQRGRGGAVRRSLPFPAHRGSALYPGKRVQPRADGHRRRRHRHPHRATEGACRAGPRDGTRLGCRPRRSTAASRSSPMSTRRWPRRSTTKPRCGGWPGRPCRRWATAARCTWWASRVGCSS